MKTFRELSEKKTTLRELSLVLNNKKDIEEVELDNDELKISTTLKYPIDLFKKIKRLTKEDFEEVYDGDFGDYSVYRSDIFELAITDFKGNVRATIYYK